MPIFRSMLIAVREYTNKKVDVIAYSMGSPIARKVHRDWTERVIRKSTPQKDLDPRKMID